MISRALTHASVALTVAAALGCSSPETEPAPLDNKALVLEALDAIMVQQDVSLVDQYFAEPYLQHNPQVPSGLEALRELVAGLAQNPDFRYERFRTVASGDLVAVHGRYTAFAPVPLIAVDLFRVQDGKIVEHWDTMQPEAGPSPSGHTMVDGPTEITDLDRTDANRQLVSDLLESVLVNGEAQRLPEFFDGDTYIQHNPNVADGLSGLGAYMQMLQEQGVEFHYTRVHRIVAEGNFVISQSEGVFGGKPQAFYDIFRVQNNKIAEHWDAIQEVPAESASGLGMF